MTYRTYIIIIACCIFTLFSCNSPSSKIDVLKKFGTDRFEKESWKNGNPVVRGKMIYDYLNYRRPLTLMTRNEIVNDLGESTGYYMYDTFPAYAIGEKPLNSHQNTSVIAFIVDHDTGKVKDIHIEPTP
jgi:hypothetical protein